jgi:dTDP-4-amino-4,6-dideoxygalactose transaminase
VGATHACAVSNCTAALSLALKVAGVQTGDEVVTVSHSFIATANSIRYLGAKPVFVDIDPETYNLRPDLLVGAMGPRTRAILVVHQLGMPCDLAAILPLARERGLAVIEDAACAVGSEVLSDGRWERIGKPHADIACFSFHPRKLLTTGEGGMLTTARQDWDDKLRLWRQHAMSVSDRVRHASSKVVRESYEEVGFNLRMSDIAAAVGREQLKRLPEMLARRRAQVELYRRLLRPLEALRLPRQDDWARSNWQSLCLRFPSGFAQEEVMQRLLDLGISTRRGVMCCHREPAYPAGAWSCRPGQWRCPCGASCLRLSASEAAQDHSLIVPLFHDLREDEQARVAEALAGVFR